MGRMTLREARQRIEELEARCTRFERERAAAIDGITSGTLAATPVADRLGELLKFLEPRLLLLRADNEALNRWIADRTGQSEE